MNRLLKHPAISIVLVCAIIGSCCFNGVFAASGGVMGGSSFSFSSFSSFSNPGLSHSFSNDYSHYPRPLGYKTGVANSHYDRSSYIDSPSTGNANDVSSNTLGDIIVICVFILLVFLARFVINYVERDCALDETMSAHSAKPLLSSSSSSTIIKLHVALVGTQRFQRDLNEIAVRADTSTRKGFRNILTESSLFLIRRSDSWASSHLSVSKEKSQENAEKYFNELSFKERSKFDRETLVNLDDIIVNIDVINKQENSNQDLEDSRHKFIVVTILVAALGVVNLPSIENPADLKTVLEEFMSISEKDILAVQVLWTPQEENEVISSEKINQDYPLLKSHFD